MTVAFDAFGVATANTGGGTNPQRWTHTPAGTPSAVVVMIQAEATTALTVSSVTYGGVAMTAHADSPLTGGEGANNRLWIYTLYSGIPTGAQTVSVTYGGTPSAGTNCRSVTLTGDALETHASAHSDAANVTNPKISVACTKDSIVLGMLNSGQDANASITVDANTTQIGGVVGVDVGAVQHCFARKTALVTAGNTDGPGWTAASDDAFMYAIAVAEAGGTEQSTGGSIAGDGALAGVAVAERATGGTAAGAGAAAGAAARETAGGGTLDGAGALSAAAARDATTGATATGDGTLAGAATVARDTGGTAAGVGELEASAAIDHAAGGTIAGTGVLAGSAAFEIAAGGAITGSGALAGGARREVKAGASIAATAVLDGQALRDGLAGGQLTATGELVLAATLVERAAGATITGDGVLTGRALSVRAHPPMLPFASTLTVEGRESGLAVTTHDSNLEVSP